MIKDIKNKKITRSDLKNQQKKLKGHLKSFRRALYLDKDYLKGQKIKEKDIVALRPNNGYDARNYKKLAGKKTKKNINKLEKIILNTNV